MSSLRRDLIDRRMWVIVALLIAAVVAVPVLLVSGGSAGGAPAAPPPPAAAARAPAAGQPASTGVKSTARTGKSAQVAMAHTSRDPFTGASGSTTTTSAGTSSGSTPASSASASSASSAPAASPTSSATTAAMVSPSPTTSRVSGSGASTPATGQTPASTSRLASSGPVSTTATVTPRPAVQDPSWTLYSVAVRYGKDTSVRLRTNLARLTPLPSAGNPQAMFLGVMTGGTQVVFALRSGVGHTGRGLCRPDHARCSAILLRAGQTEHLTIPVAGGSPRHMILRVVRITHTVTHSRKVALAAYRRYSTAGLCDLALADPVLYNLGTGTVSGVPQAVCDHHPTSVAFTPLVTAP